MSGGERRRGRREREEGGRAGGEIGKGEREEGGREEERVGESCWSTISKHADCKHSAENEMLFFSRLCSTTKMYSTD